MCISRYASKFKVYIGYNVSKKRVYISRHVLFNESKFPYLALVNQVSHNVSHTISPSFQPLIPVPNHNNVMVVPQSNEITSITPTFIQSMPHTPFMSSPVYVSMSSTTPSHNCAIED